jgi:hypothetical protein
MLRIKERPQKFGVARENAKTRSVFNQLVA